MLLALRLLLPAFLALPFALRAGDIWVSQSGGIGTNSLAWLNTPGNLAVGAGKVNPGDTVHLVGTFSNVLNVSGSGSAGNPVTFLFEPGAKFSASLWPASGAINITAKNWIVIDGGSNGLIENTNNGTSLGNQAQSFGVLGAQSSHLTVQNLTITNMYHRTDISDWNRMGECIDITDRKSVV